MLEEAGHGTDDAGVGDNRLDDDGRDPARPRREGTTDRGRVVERQDDRGRRDRLGHAGATGDCQGRQTRARLDEQPIRVPVVGAREFDDEVPAGCSSRDPQRAHHRLGARRGEAKTLHRRHRPLDRLAQLDLERVRRAQGKTVRGCTHHRLDDRRMGVAEDGRPPGTDVVDIAPSVGVPDMRSAASFEHERPPADGAERPDRAVDPAREQPLRALDEPRRPRTRRSLCHQPAPSSARISSIDRRIPSRIGLSLTVERRLSVPRRARTRSPNATRSSVS